MDQQYDECNAALAAGEVNGYDEKFLSHTFITVAFSVSPEILTFPVYVQKGSPLGKSGGTYPCIHQKPDFRKGIWV